MKSNFIKYIGVVLLFAVTLTSCRKDSFIGEETGNAGTTFMKIPTGAQVNLFFDQFTDTKLVDMISISRDAANAEELNKTVTIKLDQDASLITAHNTKTGDDYVELPAEFYSFAGTSGFTKTAAGYDVVFSPGSFAQNFKINLDGSNWTDKNKRYALAFRVSDWGGVKKSSATSETVMVFFSIKNDYDGKYAVVDGAVQRFSSPGVPTVDDALNGSMAGNDDVTLTSMGRYKVGITGLKWSGNSSGVAGIDGLQATINPDDNTVTITATGNATVANIPGEVNSYDPATRTFTLNFDWNQTANMRTIKGLKLTYKGSR